MNDQTKLAKSALLMAVRVSLVLSRTVERRGRGFRTLNRFKLYYSLPGMGLLQNTVTCSKTHLAGWHRRSGNVKRKDICFLNDVISLLFFPSAPFAIQHGVFFCAM